MESYCGSDLMIENVPRFDWIPQIFIRLIFLFIICSITWNSYRVYKRGKKTIGMRLILTGFTLAMIGGFFAVLLAFLQSFMLEIPQILLIPLVIAWNAMQLLDVTFVIHFAARTFYVKHSPFTLSLYDVAVAMLIGMAIGSAFGTEVWSQEASFPDIVMIPMMLLILAMSFTIVFYSFASAKHQSIRLFKKSMQIFGSGVLIFVIAMFLITSMIVAITPLELPPFNLVSSMIQAIMYIVTPINTYLMYVGCFQPLWFKKRYEDWWIARQLMSRIDESKKKKSNLELEPINQTELQKNVV